jgi:hypothetical protein
MSNVFALRRLRFLSSDIFDKSELSVTKPSRMVMWRNTELTTPLIYLLARCRQWLCHVDNHWLLPKCRLSRAYYTLSGGGGSISSSNVSNSGSSCSSSGSIFPDVTDCECLCFLCTSLSPSAAAYCSCSFHKC